MNRPFRSVIRRSLTFLFVACVLIAGYGYPNGWPAWQLCLLVSCAPLFAAFVWLMAGPFRRYRLLTGLFGAVAIIGAYEAWEYGRISKPVAAALNLPDPPGEPNLYFEYDLPAVVSKLFPDNADTMLLKAVQLNYCTADEVMLQTHPYCLKYGPVDRSAIRTTLETAIATAPKTSEDVYYSYLELLVQTQADEAEIRAAGDAWKQLFPYSERPDPRSGVLQSGRDSRQPGSIAP
jgi:hypothetical protein